MNLVIAGGNIVSAKGCRQADIGVRSGKIAKVGKISRKTRRVAKKVIDATGCLVIPGAIDAHVHFDLNTGSAKTSDDFTSGTQAALAGGVTTILDYTTPEKGQDPLDAFYARRKRADQAVRCDYGLHNVIIELRSEWKSLLRRLVKLGAPSLKLFMVYEDRGWRTDDGTMFELMQLAHSLDLMVCVHAENNSLINYFTQVARQKQTDLALGAYGLTTARPVLTEKEAVARAIMLAQATSARLHLVHLSTQDAVLLLDQARKTNARITGETCPHYLVLEAKKLAGPDGQRFACCPPLRTTRHRTALLKALANGTLGAITTDHCAFSAKQKDRFDGDLTNLAFGLPGVETSLNLTYSQGPALGNLSLARWVHLHTEGPAKLFGLYPRKGSLQIGTDADIVVWDPDYQRRLQAKQLQTQCDWNPYEGRLVRGQTRHVLLRGIEVVREATCLGRGVRGRYIPRRA